MLKVLINAYACSPNMGSEPGMAWNWCVNLAKHCELYIITEGEFRDKIEKVLPTLPQGRNMHFYYNPVSDEIRKMCWNQGDWRFYSHYKKWQYKTYILAKDLVKKEGIDVTHQLNMIGFREPGYLWKIKSIPFVWGPIGGLKQFPLNYLQGSGIKSQLFNRLKNIVNILQLLFDKRVNAALTRASVLVSSIPDSYRAIKRYKKLDSTIIPETGCFLNELVALNRFEDTVLKIIWVGKFDFRKQLPMALESFALCNNKDMVLEIYGNGSKEQVESAKAFADSLGIKDRIVWHGQQNNDTVKFAMQNAHIFLFTSVSEDTSTVVLEAISNSLPVVCFNACGFGAVIDNSVGRKIELSNPRQSVKEFAEQLDYLSSNRGLLKQLSQNCRERQIELSWEVKAEKMVELYERALYN